ncbi:energy transducer TonB [Flavobacterium ustbae]|uniref:hypothetical protein n=1 Tax=Flavobacterium ustbae TaxID=2488790 RepID=UPI000F76BDBD|nr:hypothetical protein [Flavobacterium ustbae]
METKPKIIIPKPCNEDWDKMTPNENGRFCLSCSKTVVDFSSMLPEEIKHYFDQHRNEKICGRFKESQIDILTIRVPNRILYSQTNYHKIFLLALFITMGTTLFSCADKDGSKRKIDKVEIIKDTATTTKSFNSKVSSNLDDSIRTKTSKVNRVKFVKPVPTHCSEITYDENQKEIEKDSVFEEHTVYYSGESIETSPYFEGGINNFYQFFITEFQFPEDAENPQSRIVVSFVIERDGSLSSFQFPREVDSKIKAEIIRVLNLSPKWIPGEQNGKKTRTKYSLPIAIES